MLILHTDKYHCAMARSQSWQHKYQGLPRDVAARQRWHLCEENEQGSGLLAGRGIVALGKSEIGSNLWRWNTHSFWGRHRQKKFE